MSDFLDPDKLSQVSTERFRSTVPFPWIALEGALLPERFAELRREFPPFELFQSHRGLARASRQRPHDRYYLAYERSIYDRLPSGDRGGVVRHAQLAPAWQAFLDELQDGPLFSGFVRRLLGRATFEVRYAWHLGFSGADVSPHVDTPKKLGTQIFYFNDRDDWQPDWGGETLILAERLRPVGNPEISDFAQVLAVPFLGNRSLFFMNTAQAWHGVGPLRCPEGRFRRLFNVIFEVPGARTGAACR